MARRSNTQEESDGNRQVALDKALGDITKRYGDGAIMRLGEAQHLLVEAIPTGALSLDIALGVGGIPRGRITEIYGPESSGKPPCASISSPKRKNWAAPAPLWIWSTPWTHPMPRAAG
jgi:hypothetical protein